MHLQKLTDILTEFSPKSRSRFNHFIESPYFGISAPARILWRYLYSLPLPYDEEKLSARKISAVSKTLSTTSLQSKYGTELYKAIERFIALEQVQQEGLDLALIKGLKTRGLHLLADAQMRQKLSRMSLNKYATFDDLYEKHLILEQQLSGFESKRQRTIYNDINPLIRSLEVFYLVKMLRYQCELISRNQVLGIPCKGFDDLLIQYETDEELLKNEYVSTFILVYKTLSAKDVTTCRYYYQKLNSRIKSLIHSAKINFGHEVISYIINVCLYWNNCGDRKFGAEYLQWIDYKTEHRMLPENGGYLQPITFRNAILLGLDGHRSDSWISAFINRYQPLLPPDVKDANTAFVKAVWSYHQKAYEKALPLFQLATVKKEPVFNVISRRWQFMCMYDSQKISAGILIDFLSAFEKYLSRNRKALLPAFQPCMAFIGYSRHLLKLSAASKQKFINQLQQEAHFPGKQWLLAAALNEIIRRP